MSASTKCPQCGAGLTPGPSGGQCLSCLLQLGLTAEQSEMEAPMSPETEAVCGEEIGDGRSGERIGRYRLIERIGAGVIDADMLDGDEMMTHAGPEGLVALFAFHSRYERASKCTVAIPGSACR